MSHISQISNRIKFRLLLFIGLLFQAGLGVLSPACSQDREMIPDEATWQNSFHGFAELLRKNDIELLPSGREFASLNADQTFLVALGDLSGFEIFVSEYLQRGGAILLATDLDCKIQHPKFSIRIDSNREILARNSHDALGGVRENVIISRTRRNELFKNVGEIATNRPSALRLSKGTDGRFQGMPIARFPHLQYTNSPSWDYPFIFEFHGRQEGRILAMPDHSVFNNAMLGVKDNLQFSLNTIDWLKNGDRTRAMLFVDGMVLVPNSLSNVEVYLPPPDARETREALQELLNNIGPRDQIELANEALEFAQDERLLEQLIASISINDFISQNRLLAVFICIGAWILVVVFVVFLVSNRKRPLAATSIDGLNPNSKKESNRRHFLERFRSSEAMVIHFFNRIGLSVNRVEEIDPTRIVIVNDGAGTKVLQKEIKNKKNELIQKPLNYWTQFKVGDVGRHIARWANLYDTGTLRILAEGESIDTYQVDTSFEETAIPPIPQIIG